MTKITKAVIAAAGFGTRFLPATKVVPKEMLPLIDRPIVQHLVEEAVASGIKEVILVVRPGTRMIEDHFGNGFLLENHLKNQGKKELLGELKKIGKMAKISVCYQDEKLPYGTGAPLASVAGRIKKGEYFVFMFGDDLVKSKIPAAKQLIKLWQKDKKAVILGCQEIPLEKVIHFGMVGLKKGTKNRVEKFVEKPQPEKTPSRLGSFGRFVLNREIIEILLKQQNQAGKKREFLLTDAIAAYAKEKKVLAKKVEGQWFTTGDPLNWLKANIEFALEKEEIRDELTYYLKTLKLR